MMERSRRGHLQEELWLVPAKAGNRWPDSTPMNSVSVAVSQVLMQHDYMGSLRLRIRSDQILDKSNGCSYLGLRRAALT